MYPSHDLNPIAFEHWQRERLAANTAFVDSAAARSAQPPCHRIVAAFFKLLGSKPVLDEVQPSTKPD
mgnify:CR=1 FL=1